MTNIQYQVNIIYEPHVQYYIATFPEIQQINLVGTGSSYPNALTALLATASSYTNIYGNQPNTYFKTW